MYPLMQPALDHISQQVYEKQSTEGITYEEANQYTSVVLLNAINDALSRAEVEEEKSRECPPEKSQPLSVPAGIGTILRLPVRDKAVKRFWQLPGTRTAW